MAETVLITTQDLEPAVRLRDAFRDAGYGVELITPGERVADVPDAALLVLTGALEDRQARRLTREASEHDGLPVIGLFDSVDAMTTEAKQRIGIHEGVAKPVDPADVVLIGRRLIDRGRLRRVTGIVGETDPMIETLERVVQIAPVRSRPELRARGYARELMLANLRENFDNGPPLSTLYPAAPKLYRNLGWEFAGSRCEVGANLNELPTHEHGLELRPGTDDDVDVLRQLYARRLTHENGCLDRNGQIWQRVRRAPAETPLFCYIAERDGVPEAYTLYTQRRVNTNGFRYDMLVRDLVCTTQESAHAMITHFARNRSVANRMQFFTAPDDPLLMELMRTQEVAIVQRMQWMLRIVRVRDALQARGYHKHVAASASVNIVDEILPGNHGPWTFELSDGAMHVKSGGDGPTLDIRGLAALYSASQGPHQLRAAGMLRGDDSHDAALAAMFAGTAPWMPDFF